MSCYCDVSPEASLGAWGVEADKGEGAVRVRESWSQCEETEKKDDAPLYRGADSTLLPGDV